MKKLLLLPLLALLTGVLVTTALSGGDNRKVLDSNVLAPVVEPYTGSANAIRGVSGGGLPWMLGDARSDLRSNGRLHVEVEGLVLANRAPVPENLRGTNPIPQFRAIVSCRTISGGAATIANVSTDPVDATPTGDAEIDTSVSLPSPCYAPIVFVTSPGGAWFAATGR